MLIDSYYEHLMAQLDKCRTTQREAVLKAGKMMADHMEKGQMVHVHDTGHIINSEVIQRSGGLAAPQMLRYYLRTESWGRGRPEEKTKFMGMEGMAELVLRCSKILPGDLLIIGSVSGRSDQVVDLAITAKKYGCQVIALTSLEYSSNVKSAHSSGLRLFEVADHVIDNCAPLGDGMMHIEGLEMPFAPASGISAAFLMWQVCAACVEELMSRGITPSILKSSNTPGGDEYNLEMEHRVAKYGY